MESENGSRRPDLSNSQAVNGSAVAAPRQATEIALSRPGIKDAAGIHALVELCKPLDLNSTYAYLLLCHHFGATCVVAKSGGRIVGFVSAYRPPADHQVLFIWQVAVDPQSRGTGLGADMVQQILVRADLKKIRYLETTVSPSNHASRRMFERIAHRMNVSLQEHALFGRDCFGGDDHEEEVLFRIGPIQA